MQPRPRHIVDQEILDFSFYLIQRGEAGYKSGCKENKYKCSKGVETIGYGIVVEKGYNLINYTADTIDEKTAVFLTRSEMHNKLYQKCRAIFPTRPGLPAHACFDTMLPCYQAVIVDKAFQGALGPKFIKAIKNNNIATAISIVSDDTNKERAFVRSRALEMGRLIEMYHDLYPNKIPQEATKELAQEFLTAHKDALMDETITRDELALLYRSCMASYNITVTEKEVEDFANSYSDVAVGKQGIGDPYRLAPDSLVTKKEALSYLTPASHGNNPRDGFTKEQTKTVSFDTLSDGYAALVQRIQSLNEKGEYTTLEFWRAYTGVRDVSEVPLIERVREKGVWIDDDTKLNLDDPQVFEAVALSISEINSGGRPLGGKQAAIDYIAAAAGYDPQKIKRLKYKPSLTETLHTTRPDVPEDFDLSKLPPKSSLKDRWNFLMKQIEAQKKAAAKQTSEAKKKSSSALQKGVSSSTTYRETAPSAKNEYNNPGRICKKGIPIKYNTLKLGYEKLTEVIYNNHNGRTTKELVAKLMGGNEAQSKKMLTYMQHQGLSVKDINTKLDLNDPKVLEGIVLSYTMLRHKGVPLGGDAYARTCVQNYISRHLSQNDGVTVVVDPTSLDVRKSLAAAAEQVVGSDFSLDRNVFNQRDC